MGAVMTAKDAVLMTMWRSGRPKPVPRHSDQRGLLIQLPIVMIAAAIGVWLSYVQHQFEQTYWKDNRDWTHSDAALNGSSFYDPPRPLMWGTGNIGIHHLHHLSSRIPFYRLPEVQRDFPELASKGRLTFWRSLPCVRLTLWDEGRMQLIAFRLLA